VLCTPKLPPYAPDRNPIELVCCMSKYRRLANHGIAQLERLHQAAQRVADEVALEQDLLQSRIRHTELRRASYPSGD